MSSQMSQISMPTLAAMSLASTYRKSNNSINLRAIVNNKQHSAAGFNSSDMSYSPFVSRGLIVKRRSLAAVSRVYRQIGQRDQPAYDLVRHVANNAVVWLLRGDK